MSPGRPLSVLPAVTEGVTHWLCGIARTTDYCALLPGGDYFPFMRICFFLNSSIATTATALSDSALPLVSCATMLSAVYIYWNIMKPLSVASRYFNTVLEVSSATSAERSAIN